MDDRDRFGTVCISQDIDVPLVDCCNRLESRFDLHPDINQHPRYFLDRELCLKSTFRYSGEGNGKRIVN